MDFEYDVVFSGNKVLTDGDDFARDGGALCVAPRGEVSFDDFVYFMGNEAESGGQGGAISNSGYLVFKRASYFVSNTAKGEPCLQEMSFRGRDASYLTLTMPRVRLAF